MEAINRSDSSLQNCQDSPFAGGTGLSRPLRKGSTFSRQKGDGSPEGRRSDCPPWDCRTERSERAEGPKVEQSAAARYRRPRARAGFVRHVAVVGTVVGGLLSVREIVYNNPRF